ncbi:MAG: hypothetical protein GY733_04080 [bacterium]|nr:hypothetical protein [bacterium]
MDASPSPLRAATDALAFSSVLPAAVAASLTAVATLAFGLPLDGHVLGLAAGGTLVVYNVDRLRDLARDRALAARRSAFVERNRSRLLGLAGAGALLCLVCALALAPGAWMLCAFVLGLGLLHRRLKRVRGIKTLYLTISWLAVVLGLPILAREPPAWPGGERFYWVAGTIGCALLANLMASNLDRKRADEQRHPAAGRQRLGPAIAIAGLGIGVGVVAPEVLRTLALIPAAQFVALGRLRQGQQFGSLVVDGALLVGACATLLLACAMGGFVVSG